MKIKSIYIPVASQQNHEVCKNEFGLEGCALSANKFFFSKARSSITKHLFDQAKFSRLHEIWINIFLVGWGYNIKVKKDILNLYSQQLKFLIYNL